ncbi:uncharacterized protein K452DRAFT_117985 [Aplosporella prunicola CBS 121167]|uniref:Uncharacterized protein n=1 Tax=Aplosporella prunicola CBS 121167 TaxID=1176127 RepID=A0A6A6B0M7_9PEZI|nr:uncharacterized protein K452DRAFT_117985 [Aplosporella prunicola CBS 121167]KAF2136774.1 hypothetical protein K452DRAFT_117985 [Aplosporella prunicola CBS 121167]
MRKGRRDTQTQRSRHNPRRKALWPFSKRCETSRQARAGPMAQLQVAVREAGRTGASGADDWLAPGCLSASADPFNAALLSPCTGTSLATLDWPFFSHLFPAKHLPHILVLSHSLPPLLAYLLPIIAPSVSPLPTKRPRVGLSHKYILPPHTLDSLLACCLPVALRCTAPCPVTMI